jgi:hypothetical protein
MMKVSWFYVVCFGLLLASPLFAMALRNDDPGAVAQRFINAHVTDAKGEAGTINWVQANPDVTARFKAKLKRLYGEALAEDPGYGYGADAILGGQDAADCYRIGRCVVEGPRAQVLLLGEGSEPPLEVRVHLIQENGRWLVDASGDLIKD